MDTSLDWRLQRFDESDHDHCLLSWRTIMEGDMAYRSRAGWITVDAYDRYIENDPLRLRASSQKPNL